AFHYATIGGYLVMAVVSAITGVATVRRWSGLRAWTGTVSWLTMILAVFAAAMAVTIFESMPARSYHAPLPLLMLAVPPLLMVLIAIFALWAKRKEERRAATARSGEVTAAGVVLLLIGIGFGAGAVALVNGFNIPSAPGTFGMFVP